MVRDGKRERERRLGPHRVLDDAAVERLRERVRRDEPEPLRLPLPNRLGGMVPPEHDEVDGLRHARIGLAERLGVAVAERVPHPLVADEGWVADDEVRLGPLGRARVRVVVERDLRRGVRHLLPRRRVRNRGASVPDRDRRTVLTEALRLCVVGQHRVAARDVAVGAQDRIGEARRAAMRAQVPLEVADPQHEVGDGGGARVDLDAE